MNATRPIGMDGVFQLKNSGGILIADLKGFLALWAMEVRGHGTISMGFDAAVLT
jgi:hypothetical protein